MNKTNNIITRFAPSPTGYLHVGNARVALINYLFAQKNNGKFILRIDDTDKSRFDSEYLKRIYEDLSWMGLKFDFTFKQTEQTHAYNTYIKKLIDFGKLYPCYETEEELELKRKEALQQGKPFIYDRTSLNLNKRDILQFDSEGRKKHYRFKLDHKTITWQDMIKGEISFNSENLSDPILVKSDGEVVYILASVIDDVRAGVTHIIRGEDHLTNTAIQIEIFESIAKIHNQIINEINLLDVSSDNAISSNRFVDTKYDNELFTLRYYNQMPKFGHLGLIKAKDGKISKREGGFSVHDLKSDINPMALKSFLTFMGTSKNIIPYTSDEEIINEFDIESYSKSPTEYSEKELELLNRKLMHKLSFEYINTNYPEITENFWEAVKFNINNESELQTWNKLLFDTKISQSTDAQQLLIAKILLDYIENYYGSNEEAVDPSLELNLVVEHLLEHKTIKEQKTAFTKQQVYQLLRSVLLGGHEGPELKMILKLLSKDDIVNRIKIFIYGNQ